MSPVAVVTGSASGMGAAVTSRLTADGWRVIGVDLRGADVEADLGTRAGRLDALAAVGARCDVRLDAVATFAGISGFTDAGGDVVTAVDYFGTVELLEGLRPLLAAAGGSAALAVSSNAATTTPDVDMEVVDACLEGDEQRACARSREIRAPAAYAAAKFAVARWVRRAAPTASWIGAGISLNALAPGMVDTPMTQAMRERADAQAMLERWPLPIGRAASPDELAAMSVFLLGPSARFVVGSVVLVDGGTEAVIRAEDWPSSRQRRRRATP